MMNTYLDRVCDARNTQSVRAICTDGSKCCDEDKHPNGFATPGYGIEAGANLCDGGVNAWVDCGPARLSFRAHSPHLPAIGSKANIYAVEKN